MVIRKGKAAIRASSGKKIEGKLLIGTLGVNCFQYTKDCVESVRSNFEETHLFYVDNGSTEETLALIDVLKDTHRNPDITSFEVLANGFNNGVGKGWNQIIDKATEIGATHIIICNNDIRFGPHTIDGMGEAYKRLREEDETTVMVTAANRTKNPNQLDKIPQEWEVHEHPDFSCMMITPETIQRVGKFAEHYEPAYFEDNDYHWRILLQGYKAFGTNWAPYSHIASRTRDGNPNIVTHENWRANKVKFFQTMIANDVDEEVARERYKFYQDNSFLNDVLESQNRQPDIHPPWEEVQKVCKEKGFISPELVRQVEDMNIFNVPMDNYVRGALSNEE